MRNVNRVILVSLLVVLIWSILNLPGAVNSALLHLYYIPIYLSARMWGSRGGAAVGVAAGVLSGPLMLEWSGLTSVYTPANWLIRTVFFIGLGWFLGILFASLHRSRKRIVEQNEKIYKQKQEIERLGTEIIQAIAQAIEVRDHYTSGHCNRVAHMAVEVGKRLGLSNRELMHLRWSGIVHDVGKIGIPEEILNKPGKLTPEEYGVMKRHSALGAKILSSTRYSEEIIEGVRHHHERIDGTGYPDGISGGQIPLQAKIIAISDVWDALTSKRSYRGSFSFEQALEIMKNGRGTQFDPDILDVFLELIEHEQASGRALELLRASKLEA